MKIQNRFKIVVITMLMTFSVWADASEHENDQTEMPIVIDGKASPTMESTNRKKIITTRERPMKHHQHHNLPIIYPHINHQLMPTIQGHFEHNDHQHMPGNEAGSNASTNHHMIEMHQQHRAEIEQRLADIEALLEKLVEMQSK